MRTDAEVDRAIDAAYEIGMHQHREEIRALADLLCQRLRPMARVLEIGTLHGGTAVLWKALGATQVITLDLPTGNFGGAAHGYGDFQKVFDRSQRLIKQEILPAVGDSHDWEAARDIAGFLDGHKVDFLFIDGDHSLSGVAADYEIYRRFVRPGGLIAFHDIRASQFHHDAGCYVDVLWTHLLSQRILTKRWEFLAPGQVWGGIGILEA